MSNKCPVCQKTAYPMESQKANGVLYHKSCFKCTECRRQLSTDTFYPHSESGQVYCKTHYPQPKNLQAVDTLEMRRAKDGPKLDTVNRQIQGKGSDMQKNLQATDTMDLKRAKDGPKLGTVNNQVIGGEDVHKNLQIADMATSKAMNGPKLGTVNYQIIGGEEVHKNLQVADMTTTDAQNRPKLDVVKSQIIGGEDAHKNLQVADMTTTDAQNRPKLDVEAGICKSESKHNFNGLTGF